jgi:hypothetical protein
MILISILWHTVWNADGKEVAKADIKEVAHANTVAKKLQIPIRANMTQKSIARTKSQITKAESNMRYKKGKNLQRAIMITTMILISCCNI